VADSILREASETDSSMSEGTSKNFPSSGRHRSKQQCVRHRPGREKLGTGSDANIRLERLPKPLPQGKTRFTTTMSMGLQTITALELETAERVFARLVAQSYAEDHPGLFTPGNEKTASAADPFEVPSVTL